MQRAAIVALAAVLLLTLAPVGLIFWRSLDVSEQVARPAGPAGAPGEPVPDGGDRGRLIAIETADGVPMARVDLKTLRQVDCPAYQIGNLGLREGDVVEFRRTAAGTADVWREAPKGDNRIGLRRGRVVGLARPSQGRQRLTIDEEREVTVRWAGTPAEGSADAEVLVRTEHHFGFGHYAGVLGGVREAWLLIKSVGLAVLVALCAFCIGFPLGVLTTRTNVPGARWLAVAYVAPLLIPPYVAAIGWVRLGGASGLLTNAVRGQPDPSLGPLLPVYGLSGSVLVLSLCWFPIVTLLTRVALARGDRAADEAGLLLGGPNRVCWRLIAPAALAGGGAGAAFVFLFALSSYGAPSLMRFVVFSADVFAAFNSPAEMSAAAATGMPLVVMAIVGLAFLAWCERRRVANPVRAAVKPEPLQLGWPRWPLGIAAWAAVIGAAGVPMFGLAWQSQARSDRVQLHALRVAGTQPLPRGARIWFVPSKNRVWAARPAGEPEARAGIIKQVGDTAGGDRAVTIEEQRYGTITLASFGEALKEMRGDFRHSLLTALWTALAAVLVAAPLGWLLARSRWREGGWLDVLLLLPFAIPPAVLASGLISLWNRPGVMGAVYASPAFLSMALAIRLLPFAVRPAALSARAVPQAAVDAAALSGASWWRRAGRLWLPLAAPGIASGALLVFILALGDIDVSRIARSPGWQTLQVRIFTAIHFGREEVVCAACVLLVLLCTVPVAIYALATARKPRVV